MSEERFNEWIDDSRKECPHGCGQTLHLVHRDRLFTRPDGKRVLGEDVELLECSLCGEVFVPSRTARLIARFFQGDIEASGTSEIPTLSARTA